MNTYSWEEFLFCLVSPHRACSTELHHAFSIYWSEENINTCHTFFWARCHHGLCSEIIDRPFPNIKLDRHLVPTGVFFVIQFANDVRDTYTKKTADEIAAEGNCRRFLQGTSERVAWRATGFGSYPQRKRIPKKCQQEVESVAESKIVLNQHAFVSIFGQETEEKVEK